MLAIFDLDETLIQGDSSQLFTEFLRAQEIERTDDALDKDRDFMSDYRQGRLNLQAYMEFSLAPLQGWHREQLNTLVSRFIDRVIASRVLPTGRERVAWHKAQGHRVLIISATGEHLVKPIAQHLGIEEGIGVEVEWRDGSLTGQIGPRRPFQEGKVAALREWLGRDQVTPEKTWFYSDSHNDLPLLEQVDFPVAVNPDPRLRQHAQKHGWQILTDSAALP
ncbi:HAD-superfamily hydrolase subfamily IB, PSPase-like [Marinobacter nauticus ATCC 49840]|uniref:HAD family hydrolase n=1 Tax=Marinobacter nauticus TaxID=2743 RepID=UPI000256E541|nr:HAD family hydrolase [Marinobacter nauticus]CCG94639.1 HAD-superfamily hydrolase subfamily IB, PSPase-like [Marinobacter nauticus ATCC 49840]